MLTPRRWPRFAIAAACLLSGSLAIAPPTVAQRPTVRSPTAADTLAAARAELDAARFAEAARFYDAAAAASTGLDRGALVRLLRERALTRAALRDRDGARADLTALLSLDPAAELGPEAPPSVRRLLDEARTAVTGPIEVTAEALPIDGGFEVRAAVSRDPAGVVREVRVLELRGASVEVHGAVARIAAEGDLRYTVEAVGWGGAVVAHLGTATEPRVVHGVAATLRAQAPPSADDPLPWIGVGIGGAAAIALAVALAVFFTTTTDVTRPTILGEIE